MNIDQLVPKPGFCETFRRSRERFIPETSGCYVLTTISNVVLYIGLTVNLRSRMNQHLDSPEKTAITSNGRACLFYWLVCGDINKVERTWLNIHLLHEGALPELNKIYSPTTT